MTVDVPGTAKTNFLIPFNECSYKCASISHVRMAIDHSSSIKLVPSDTTNCSKVEARHFTQKCNCITHTMWTGQERLNENFLTRQYEYV